MRKENSLLPFPWEKNKDPEGKKPVSKEEGRARLEALVKRIGLQSKPGVVVDNPLIITAREAEEHKGPSVIVAYTPCTTHGIKSGMQSVQDEMKRAVQSGYWPLYRYNPDLEEKKMCVDCKAPCIAYEDFLDGENRYAALRIKFPENAEKLFKQAADDAADRYKTFKKQEEL